MVKMGNFCMFCHSLKQTETRAVISQYACTAAPWVPGQSGASGEAVSGAPCGGRCGASASRGAGGCSAPHQRSRPSFSCPCTCGGRGRCFGLSQPVTSGSLWVCSFLSRLLGLLSGSGKGGTALERAPNTPYP